MTATAEQALTDAVVPRRTKFFVGFAVAMLLLAIAGFARTFYLRPLFGAVDGPTGSTALPWHLLFHGLVMTAWLALVVTQTLLIEQRNVILHRRLGIVGAALAALVIVVGMFTVVEYVLRREAAGTPITNGVVLSDTYVLLLLFPLIVGAGLYLRRDAGAHKRLMLLASIVLLGPVAARFVTLADMGVLPREWLGFLRPSALLLVMLGYDIASRRRPHWVTGCGIVWAVAITPIELWLSRTAAAERYVDWLRHLG